MNIEVDQSLRQQMFKFACLQLSNEDLAEDVVQEALLGATKNAKAFKGESAFKTWVFAILKHKIADALRKKARNLEDTNLMGDDEDQSIPDVFNRRGHWKSEEAPESWGNPEKAFKQEKFWQVFETCLIALPETQARAFMMREFVGLKSDEICEEMGMTLSNLHVQLHRARMRLRECLENRWFSEGASGA